MCNPVKVCFVEDKCHLTKVTTQTLGVVQKHTRLAVIGLGAEPAAPCAAHALDAPGKGGNAPLLGAELLNTGTCRGKTTSECAVGDAGLTDEA